MKKARNIALNITNYEQANCARKYKLSAQFGTSMSA